MAAAGRNGPRGEPFIWPELIREVGSGGGVNCVDPETY